MEDPLSSSGQEATPDLHVIHPPDHLKPKEDFHRLLSEFRQWAETNPDRSHALVLQAAGHMEDPVESVRELRHMIRGREAAPGGKSENHALKWHLVLHLARQMEGHYQETRQMLAVLRQGSSPLKDALEEDGSAKGFLEDLPETDSGPFGDDRHLRLIMEAWFGLFREQVRAYGFFVTLEPKVFGFVRDRLEQTTGAPPDQPGADRIVIPAAVEPGGVSGGPLLEGFSGKTLMLIGRPG
jgi:hypothetical protein